jgi:hypothetical protein
MLSTLLTTTGKSIHRKFQLLIFHRNQSRKKNAHRAHTLVTMAAELVSHQCWDEEQNGDNDRMEI